jgi:hypothetical protein
MKKKDINYRQGRSKSQVEGNEKLAFASIAIMGAVVIISLFVSLINKLV